MTVGHYRLSLAAAALFVALLWALALSVALHSRSASVAAVPHDLPISGPSEPHTYTDGQHAFLDHQPDDPTEPIGWNPCATIPVQLNPSTAPPGTLGALKETLRTMNRASGLHLSYAGTTADTEDDAWTHAGIVASLHPFDEKRDPGVPENTAGYARSHPSIDHLRRSLRYYATGAVTLDTAFFTRASHHDRSVVLSHELGHAVGLAHVEGPEIMDPGMYAITAWGHGDLTGLAKLGQLPCQ